MTKPTITSVTFDKSSYNKGDVITCTVKYANSNTHGVTNGNGVLTPVGSLIQGVSQNPTLSPTTVGNFILLHVTTQGSAPPTAISGGGCTWQQLGTTLTGVTNSGYVGAVFLGTVTAAGSAAATITCTGTPSSISFAGQEFHSSTGQFAFVEQANLDAFPTNTSPALTPTVQAELYSFYGHCTGSVTVGNTAGYTYDVTSLNNIYLYNQNCTIAEQAPTVGSSTVTFGIAVVIAAPQSTGMFQAIGSLIQSLTTSITVNPQNVGDMVLLWVYSGGGAPPIGVSGGNCTWEQVGQTFSSAIAAGLTGALFVGTATATGSATATATFNGTPTSVSIDGHEFYSSTGTWSFVSQVNLDSAGTNQLPTLTPTGPNQLYFVGVIDTSTFTAGATTGYTYETDANGNGLAFNPQCTLQPQAPTAGDAHVAFGIAILMSTASPSGTTSTPSSAPLITSIATAGGTDPYGNPYVQGLGVEKGVINGTVISAGNTIVIDSNGLSVYNGAQQVANLQLSITPQGGISTKTPIALDQFGIGTPPPNSDGSAIMYSTKGDVQTVDGLDQQTYALGRRSLATGSDQNVTTTTFGTILSSTVATNATAREYRVHAQLFIAPNQTGGKVGLRWTGPGSTIGHVNFVYTSGTSANNSGALGNGTSTGGVITMTMVNGQEIEVVIDGVIQVPANTSGLFTIDAAEGTSGDSFIVRQFSYLDVMPV